MPIANRDKDVSEQKLSYTIAVNGSVTGSTVAAWSNGATVPLMVVPYNSQLMALNVSAFGLSGAPTGELRNHRFIAGAGITVITGLASSMILQTFGTSGALSASLVAAGSTLLQLLAGDVLTIIAGTSSTGADKVLVGITLKALQDFKADFGSTT